MSIAQLIQLKPDLLRRIESALSESTYRDAIENSSKYNNRLVEERKTRLPFIDSQTGVAQNNCYLWMHRWERMPGANEGQIYSYPARRWKKRRRGYLINQNSGQKNNLESDNDKDANSSNIDQIIKTENSDSMDKYDNSKDNWLSEFEEGDDLPDAGELDETSSDESFSEYMPRRKGRKKKDAVPPTTSKRRKQADKDRDNQTSFHSKSRHERDRDSSNSQSNSNQPQHSVPLTVSSLLSSASSSSRSTPVNDTPDNPRAKDEKATPNKYCDFCLGDSEENKKTKAAEKMVSCFDCGRSAHPTCLQFTPRMVMSIKKYRWQCLECKSCALCGTSDNDDQLLFCDDCDRGYHMYCLQPPLSEPPEGSWSCRLCIAEYHSKRK